MREYCPAPSYAGQSSAADRTASAAPTAAARSCGNRRDGPGPPVPGKHSLVSQAVRHGTELRKGRRSARVRKRAPPSPGQSRRNTAILSGTGRVLRERLPLAANAQLCLADRARLCPFPASDRPRKAPYIRERIDPPVLPGKRSCAGSEPTAQAGNTTCRRKEKKPWMIFPTEPYGKARHPAVRYSPHGGKAYR